LLVVPTSPGDVLDRLTILRLKQEHARDPAVRTRVDALRAALEEAWSAAGLPASDAVPEYAALAAVNAALWDVEDALREHEARGDFGPAFVALARDVYRWNDRRSALKADIDRRLDASMHEPKLHR
jgi:hypothetical protein